MKLLSVLTALVLAANGFAQSAPTTKPLYISSLGVGDLKIDLPLAKANALLDQPITVKKANAKNQEMDTLEVMYKGRKLTLELYWKYIDEKRSETAIYSIYSSNANLGTKSGIGLGANKFDIVKKLDGYSLSLYPNWRYELPADKKRYSILTLQDGDAGTTLVMYFDNNVLYAFEVRAMEGC